MLKRTILTILVIISVVVNGIYAQSVKELEAQKRKAQQKLNATQKLLNETKKSRKGTEKELNLLTRSIKETNNLIFSINSEIEGLNRDITNLMSEKKSLTQRLEITKQEYAKMIATNYVFKRQFSPIFFIFSSKNFSQGLRRARYLVEMSNYRKEQVLEIKNLTQSIEEKENQLHNYVTQKSESLHQKEQQSKKLNKKKEEQNRLLKNYNQKEREYTATIKEEQQRQKNLNELIRKKVAEENRKKAEMAKKAESKQNKKEKASKTGTKKSTNTTKGSAKSESTTPIITDKEYKQYKEDKLLTGSFTKNKGSLPMPVESGKIHRKFGRQTNPLTNTIENNSGIYILTPSGMEARAVFEGTVFEVMYEPGSGYIVWVTHGSYSTVYAQLSLFYVKKGEKLKSRQKIGKIAQKNNNTELNFYILNENASYENPENWLAH